MRVTKPRDNTERNKRILEAVAKHCAMPCANHGGIAQDDSFRALAKMLAMQPDWIWGEVTKNTIAGVVDRERRKHGHVTPDQSAGHTKARAIIMRRAPVHHGYYEALAERLGITVEKAKALSAIPMELRLVG